jgi:hypothetical protein
VVQHQGGDPVNFICFQIVKALMQVVGVKV